MVRTQTVPERDSLGTKPVKMASSQSWQCFACKAFYVSLFELVSHVRAAHHENSAMNFECCIDGCPRVFVNASTWYRHVRRSHADEYSRHQPRTTIESTTAEDTPILPTNGDDEDECEDRVLSLTAESVADAPEDFEATEPSPTSTLTCTKYVAAGMLLKLKSECRLTQRAMREVVEMTGVVCGHMIGEAQTVVKTVAEQHSMELSPPFIQGLQEAHQHIPNPLADLGTAYRQHSYVARNFPYVVSVN